MATDWAAVRAELHDANRKALEKAEEGRPTPCVLGARGEFLLVGHDLAERLDGVLKSRTGELAILEGTITKVSWWGRPRINVRVPGGTARTHLSLFRQLVEKNSYFARVHWIKDVEEKWPLIG